MNDLMRRVASLLAGVILAALGAFGVGTLPPGLEEALTVWLGHTLDFLAWLAGALLDRHLRGRLFGPPRVDRWGAAEPGARAWRAAAVRGGAVRREPGDHSALSVRAVRGAAGDLRDDLSAAGPPGPAAGSDGGTLDHPGARVRRGPYSLSVDFWFGRTRWSDCPDDPRDDIEDDPTTSAGSVGTAGWGGGNTAFESVAAGLDRGPPQGAAAFPCRKPLEPIGCCTDVVALRLHGDQEPAGVALYQRRCRLHLGRVCEAEHVGCKRPELIDRSMGAPRSVSRSPAPVNGSTCT